MLFYYSNLMHMFNRIRQNLWIFTVIFVTLFPLSTLSMDKKTEEIDEKPEIRIMPSFNTLRILEGAIETIQTVLSPPVDAQAPITNPNLDKRV